MVTEEKQGEEQEEPPSSPQHGQLAGHLRGDGARVQTVQEVARLLLKATKQLAKHAFSHHAQRCHPAHSKVFSVQCTDTVS